MSEKSTYAMINRKVWNTCQFRALSPDAKTLFFYLVSCPHGNMIGLFVLRPGYALDDLQWGSDRKRFMKSLHELLDQSLFLWDEKNEIILDLEQYRKHPPYNPNQVKAAIKVLNSIPKTTLFHNLKSLVESLNESLHKPFIESLHKRYSQTVTVTEPVTVTEKTPLCPEGTQNGDCPHKDIIEAYHKILPELPKVKTWPESLQKILKTRWREDQDRQQVGWWEEYFRYVKQSDFLMGRSGTFTADLEWIVRPKNMTKVLNGRYHGTVKFGGIKKWLEDGENETRG